MAKKITPLQTLKVDRRQAIELAHTKGVNATTRMLEQAQRKLNTRLRHAEGLWGPGSDSFTTSQLRVMLEQIRQVLAEVQYGIKGIVMDDGLTTAELAAQHTVQYVKRAEQQFRGSGQRLAIREAAVLDRAVSGTESSILHRLLGTKKKKGILQRYGENTIERFEQRLQQRMLTKASLNEVRAELIAESPFLQAQPAHWAERIARTEIMNAHNRAQWEGLRAVNKEVGGGMLKILVATFDSRTGADSYAVHGQIRRPAEAFSDWTHNYQHPPNRPNDRETVVPHNIDWPIPPSLAWKSDGEVATRWRMQGNKRPLPSRPLMTTVPLDKIGNSA